MLKYALYTRKSHDDKKLTEKSTGEQTAECQAIAGRDGLMVAWKCEESKSAKTPRVRPLYSELIRLIERGKIDAILCWHVNRLVRNMEEGGKLVQLLIDGKIREIRTPHATYRSGENILPVVLEAASATQYSIDLVHTVVRSLEGNFRAGGCNHKAPPGYRNVRDELNTKRGQVAKDPDRFPLIRKAWELMLTGTVTVQDIYLALMSWGYRVRPTLNLPARPLGYSAVSTMFRNPFYAGYVRMHGELVQGRHEAMVSIDEFRRVQAIVARRTFKAERTHSHPFTGLMQCGYCGQQITAEVKKLRTGRWEIYHCSDSYNRCTQQGITEAKVDDQIAEHFSQINIDPDALMITQAEIVRTLTERQDAFQVRRDECQAALFGVEQRLNRLTEMWVSGLLTDSDRYRDMEKTALAEKQRLRLALDEQAEESERMLQNLARAVDYIKTGPERFVKAKPERKRTIAQALGEFSFYGKEKRIDVEIRPILREVVSFARTLLEPLEPSQSGSRSKDKAVHLERLYLGRTETSGLELPEPLLRALSEGNLTWPNQDSVEPSGGEL
jgi:DNA invertase Pin-like site-specific DNA recombinase